MPSDPARSKFRQRILDSLRIEPEELRPTLLLASFLMLGMATVICLKAVSDSVFLSEFDASRLPWVDLAVTALVGLSVNYYLRWTSRAPLAVVIRATQLFLVGNLLLFWLLLRLEVRYTPVLIYLWVGVFAVLIPSQAWSLAAAIFTTRQAKRLFALIGSGGILGAGLGGSFAGFVGPRIGAEAILPAAAILVAASAWLAHQLSRIASAWTPAGGDGKPDEKAPILESFGLVRGNRYLLLIALAIFVSTLAGTLVKYQFKAVAQIHFAGDRDALTSFAGYFYGYVAVFSFVFHTLMTGRLLRWIGLGGCLFILPLSLSLGMGALAFSATLGAAVFARAADQGFRHSVDRASLELLYVPVPPSLRARVKSFLDMAVNRLADGVASLILLGLLYVVGAGLAEISVVGLAFALLWLGLLWQLRGEYVRTLRSTIERKDIRAETLLQQLAQSGPSEELRAGLESSDQRDVEAALGWIQLSGPGPELAQLAALLTHPSATIRRKTMRAIEAKNVAGCEREALSFLKLETSFEERRRALDYLAAQDETAVEQLLASEDRALVALAAAKRLEGHSNNPADDRARDVLDRFLSEVEAAADPEQRVIAARLIGIAGHKLQGAEARLSRLLRDEAPTVVRAALESTALLRPRGETPRLLELLRERSLAPEARHALAAYGHEAVEAAAGPLRDPEAAAFLQRQCARVLGAIGGRDASRALLAYVRRPGRAAQSQALRALGRIRSREGDGVFDRETVDVLLIETLRRYYVAAFWLEGAGGGRGPASTFLTRAIRERMDGALEEVFVLLSLIFPQREILDAYSRIESGRRDLRANAVEFLDNRLLGLPLRASLLPAIEGAGIEGDGIERRIEAGRQLFGLERLSYPNVLRPLLESQDPWLQACACAAAAEASAAELRPIISGLTTRRGALLKESARAALDRLGVGGAQS